MFNHVVSSNMHFGILISWPCISRTNRCISAYLCLIESLDDFSSLATLHFPVSRASSTEILAEVLICSLF